MLSACASGNVRIPDVSNFFPVHDGYFHNQFGDHFAGGQFGLKNAHGNLGCMGHSWYLSNDFQMHLLMPWLLVLFRWKPRAAYAVILAGISASTGAWQYNRPCMRQQYVGESHSCMVISKRPINSPRTRTAYLGFLVANYHWSLGCKDRGFQGNSQTLY